MADSRGNAGMAKCQTSFSSEIQHWWALGFRLRENWHLHPLKLEAGHWGGSSTGILALL